MTKNTIEIKPATLRPAKPKKHGLAAPEITYGSLRLGVENNRVVVLEEQSRAKNS